MPFKKIVFHASDKTLNKFSFLTGLLIFVSPFLHFFSINVLESVFNKTLFMQFSLLAITTIVVLVLPATFIVSRFLLRVAFYQLFPIFYAGFFSMFLSTPVRHLLLILGVPPVARSVIYAIFVLLLLWIIFRLSKVREFHMVALVFALVLATCPMVRIANSTLILFDRGAISSVDYNEKWAAQISKKAVNRVDLPNIYFIVPDMYTSVAVLRDQLSFDNNPFIQEMEKRAFVHLPDSFSSYTSTAIALASLLQADYPVTEDSPRYKSREDFYPALLYKTQPFQVAKVARHLGYTVSIGNHSADCGNPYVYCYEAESKFIHTEIRSFFELTPVPRLLRNIKVSKLFSDANPVDAITDTMRYLSNASRLKSPYFMLVHYLPPHPPYLFEADCRVRSNVEFDFKEDDDRSIPLYLDNLQCANKRLIELADYIAIIDPTALIAIQADHGTDFVMKMFSKNIPFKDLTENAIRERTSVLSLVRVPDECHKWLRPDLNTVNTVRFLFGCATGTEPVYLENKSYMSFYESNPDYGRVYPVKR